MPRGTRKRKSGNTRVSNPSGSSSSNSTSAPAAPRLLERRDGGAGGEGAERFVEGEPLGERPAAALHGGADARHDAHLLDGEVAPERERRARREHAAPGVGAAEALGADARLGP